MLDRAPPWTTPARESPNTPVIGSEEDAPKEAQTDPSLFLVLCLSSATRLNCSTPASLLFHQQEIGKEKES